MYTCIYMYVRNAVKKSQTNPALTAHGHGHSHGQSIWMIKIIDGPASNLVNVDNGRPQPQPLGITPHNSMHICPTTHACMK